MQLFKRGLLDNKTVNVRLQNGRFISNSLSEMSNGNRTEWSPVRSVIIRVIDKISDLFNHNTELQTELDDDVTN